MIDIRLPGIVIFERKVVILIGGKIFVIARNEAISPKHVVKEIAMQWHHGCEE